MKNNLKLALLSIVFVTLSFSLIWKGLDGQIIETKEVAPKALVDKVSLTNNIAGEATSSTEIAKDTYRVNRVIDGDTIEVLIEGEPKTVRLIGINTPETVDPRRPVQCFGKEASNKMKELVDGKWVRLEKDVSDTDKYGRLLRYIFLPLENGESLFVDDYLVRQGYANAVSYPPDVKYYEQFKKAEEEARRQNLGLFNKCKK